MEMGLGEPAGSMPVVGVHPTLELSVWASTCSWWGESVSAPVATQRVVLGQETLERRDVTPPDFMLVVATHVDPVRLSLSACWPRDPL